MERIGRFKPVNLRELWPHEQNDFSKWLAEPDNINYVGDILGLKLTDISREVSAGSYRCDIVAKDSLSDDVIIIENQLSQTDHDHMGKLLTYAAHFNARYLVWIVPKSRDEHRRTIQFLNERTDTATYAFLVELCAYRIGNSIPAPQFRCIVQPEGYDEIRRDLLSRGSNSSEGMTQELTSFWTYFNSVLESKGTPFRPVSTRVYLFKPIAIGSSKADIRVHVANQSGNIRVEYHIKNNKDLFDKIYLHREEVERAFHSELIWRRNISRSRDDEGKDSCIEFNIKGLNFGDTSNYNELLSQTIDTVVQMKDVFGPYL